MSVSMRNWYSRRIRIYMHGNCCEKKKMLSLGAWTKMAPATSRIQFRHLSKWFHHENIRTTQGKLNARMLWFGKYGKKTRQIDRIICKQFYHILFNLEVVYIRKCGATALGSFVFCTHCVFIRLCVLLWSLFTCFSRALAQINRGKIKIFRFV